MRRDKALLALLVILLETLQVFQPAAAALDVPSVCWTLGDFNGDNYTDIVFRATGSNANGVQVNMTEVDSAYPVNEAPLFTDKTGSDGTVMFQMIPDGNYTWSVMPGATKCLGHDIIAVGGNAHPETQFTIQTSEETDFLTWFLLAQWVHPDNTQKTKSFLENLARFYNYRVDLDPFPAVAGQSNFENGKDALQWLIRLENHIDTFVLQQGPSFSEIWITTKNLLAPFQAVFENGGLFLPKDSPVGLDFTPEALRELTKVSFTPLGKARHRLFLLRNGFMGSYYLIVSALDIFELASDGEFNIHCPTDIAECLETQIAPVALELGTDIVRMAIGGIDVVVSLHNLLIGPLEKGTAKTITRILLKLSIVLAAIDLVLSMRDLLRSLPSWLSFRDKFHSVEVIIAVLGVAATIASFASLLAYAGLITSVSGGTLAAIALAIVLIAAAIQFFAPILLGPNPGETEKKVAPIITEVLNVRRAISGINETELAESADRHGRWAVTANEWGVAAESLGFLGMRDDFLWAKDYLQTLQGAERGLAAATPQAKKSLDEALRSFLYYSPESTQVRIDNIHLKYVDSNGSGKWEPGELVAYDTDGDAFSQSYRGFCGGPDCAGHFDWPITGSPQDFFDHERLSFDSKIRYIDTDENGILDIPPSPDMVVYDSNNNGLYDSGEPMIAPRVKAYTVGINSTKAEHKSPGQSGYFSFNASVYHRSPDSSDFVFDNSTITYNEASQRIEERLEETNHDKLSSKSCDIIGVCYPTGWAWDEPREDDGDHSCLAGIGWCPRPFAAFYSTNPLVTPTSGTSPGYDVYFDRDPSCFPGFSCFNPSDYSDGSGAQLGTGVLRVDNKIKYIDSNGDHRWTPYIGNPASGFRFDIGETVIYDVNDDSKFDKNDVLIAGAKPDTFGEQLSFDPKILYNDVDSDSRFELKEVLIYDSDGNGVFDHDYPSPDRIVANLETFFLYKFHFDQRSSTLNFVTQGLWVDQLNAKLISLRPKLTTLQAAIDSLNKATSRRRSAPLVTTFSDSIWIANSNEGTVSRLDTRTGRELGKYRTGIQGKTLSPASATVDQEGSAWVVNVADGTATKIALFEGNCQDRNQDGIINTSRDLDNDGRITHGALVNGTTLAEGITGDAKLKFTSDLRSVVYDRNFNGQYDQGEPVIYGATPSIGASVYSNGHLAFVDEPRGVPHFWDDYEPVVYDFQTDGVFNADDDFVYASEIFPWPSSTLGGLDARDECIIAHVSVGGPNSAPSGVAIDLLNSVWIGACNEGRWYRYRGSDGTPLPPIEGIYVGGCPSGGLVDSSGVLWSANYPPYSFIARIDTKALTALPSVSLSHPGYAVGIDTDGHIWVSGFSSGYVSRINIANVEGIRTYNVGGNLRGIAVTRDDHVWVANTSGDEVIHLDHDGAVIKRIPIGIVPIGIMPTGVAVDADGKVWVTNVGSDSACRIDANSDKGRGVVDGCFKVGRTPFNISDMTGVVARSIPYPLLIPVAFSGLSLVPIRFNVGSSTDFTLGQGIYSLDAQVKIFDVSRRSTTDLTLLQPLPIDSSITSFRCTLYDKNHDSKLDKEEASAGLNACLTEEIEERLAPLIVDNQTRAALFASALNDLSTVVALASAGEFSASDSASIGVAIVSSSKLSLLRLVGSVIDPACGYLDSQTQRWRVFCAGSGFPDPVEITAFSKVDLEITDSEGLRLSKTVNQIRGATYLEFDRNGDNQSDDIVVLPERKGVSYSIRVIPEPDSAPEDKFTLTLSSHDVGLNILTNTRIADISLSGYTLLSELLPVEAPQPTTNHRPNAVPKPEGILEGNTAGGGNVELDGTASSDPDGDPLTYQWTGDFGAATLPKPVVRLPLGCHIINLVVNDGKVSSDSASTSICIVDRTPPAVSIGNPPAGLALQDGVTFNIDATDIVGPIASVGVNIHEHGGSSSAISGSAYFDSSTGKWVFPFDTRQVPDGFYDINATATDGSGNLASTVVEYSVRNWASIQLLPVSRTNQAGRTMPVKFSLRVNATVDSTQPFVYNEQLTIQIYATSSPGTILQASTFGSGARSYRISLTDKLYITNFQTLKTPQQYTVRIMRGTFLVASFTFSTNR